MEDLLRPDPLRENEHVGATSPIQGESDIDEAATDVKLAILASLFPNVNQEVLLDLLIEADGSVEKVEKGFAIFQENKISSRKRLAKQIGHQTALSFGPNPTKRRLLTKKGQTLHLYAPEDVAQHTPCSIIHNFLPSMQADELLRELLKESETFGRATFKLFDNVVQSPHSACFYVESAEEEERQKHEYIYNGSSLTDIRQLTPQMRSVSPKVEATVNDEIANRMHMFYPGGKKLQYQSPHRWTPNAAFVNAYDGPKESVGYHSDQLTYLGPRAVIGSISLGVAREFRVRKIVAHDDEEAPSGSRADAEGQIAIHLPHNSLLIMHAEMQEEWKHAVPSSTIDAHPIAGNKRINITYRHYRESFHPMFTPKCRCIVPTVLRCVQRRKESRGRYVWMCHAGNSPDKQGLVS